jgi:hypothetical protein
VKKVPPLKVSLGPVPENTWSLFDDPFTPQHERRRTSKRVTLGDAAAVLSSIQKWYVAPFPALNLRVWATTESLLH